MKRMLVLFLIAVFFLTLTLGCRGDRNEYLGPSGDISMITPYVEASDMTSNVYKFTSQHSGVDFYPTGDLKPFRAVASGQVEFVQCFQSNPSDNYQVNVSIKYNSVYSVCYGFEPFSQHQADGTAQLNEIRVRKGQIVKAGEVIGRLCVIGDYAHVDFGLGKNGKRICPYEYFTEEARKSILELSASGRLCDCHP